MCRSLKNDVWPILLVSLLYISVKAQNDKITHRHPSQHQHHHHHHLHHTQPQPQPESQSQLQPHPYQPPQHLPQHVPIVTNSANGYTDHQTAASYDHHHEEKYPYQPYGFGYEVEDGWGNTQYRHEKGLDPWKVKGSYGYKDAWGIFRHVDYIADKWGFRAHIKTNEPGTAPKDPAAVKMASHPVPAGSHGYKRHDHKDEIPDHSKTSYTYTKHKKPAHTKVY